MAAAASADPAARLRALLSRRYELVRDRIETARGALVLNRVGDLERLVDATTLTGGDDRLPYWAELWPAAVGLARAIARDRWDFAGAATIELGCGLGLAGLAVAAAGARVVATDYERDATLFARLNALDNGRDDIRHAVMDWRRPAFVGAFSRVVAADVLYEGASLDPVADAIVTLLAPDGFALVAEPGRDVARPFFEMLRRAAWQVSEDGSERVDQGAGRPVAVTIHRLRPPCRPSRARSRAARGNGGARRPR